MVWERSALSTHFCCDLKTILTNQVSKKRHVKFLISKYVYIFGSYLLKQENKGDRRVQEITELQNSGDKDQRRHSEVCGAEQMFKTKTNMK